MLMIGISITLTVLQMLSPKNVSARPITGILLVIGIAMLSLSMFFFVRLDNIVHGDLYRYDLQFSAEWAIPYWTYLRLIFDFLAVAIGIGGVSVILITISTHTPEKRILVGTPPDLRAQTPIKLTKLICFLLTSIGIVAVAFSINLNSTIIALVGLGLIFWGAILFYVRPQGYVREVLLDKTILPMLKNLGKLIDELGYKSKGIYLPPKYFQGFESSKVYISANEDIELPLPEKTMNEEGRILIENPNGALITPPGIELKRLFEKALGTNFIKGDLQLVKEKVPRLVVEDLEIAQEVEMEISNDTVIVSIRNSIYRNVCEEAAQLSRVYSSLGCPLCSAIACALAEATGRLVVIEKIQTSNDDQTTKIEYRTFDLRLEA